MADCLRIYCRDAVNGYFVSVWSSDGRIKRVACGERSGKQINTGILLQAPLKIGLRLSGMIEVSQRMDGRDFDWHDEQLMHNLTRFIQYYFKQPINIFTEYGKCMALTERNLVNPELLKGMVERANRKGMPMENVLLANRPAIRDAVVDAFSRLYGLPFFNVDDSTKISGGLFKGTKLKFMLENGFIPLRVENDLVAVVLDNPLDVEKVTRIREHYKKMRIRFYWSFQQNISSFLEIFKQGGVLEPQSLEDSFSELDLILEGLDD